MRKTSMMKYQVTHQDLCQNMVKIYAYVKSKNVRFLYT